MTRILFGIVLGFVFNAQAAVNASKKISIQQNTVNLEKVSDLRFGNFTKIIVEGVENSRQVGSPETPVRSFLLLGTPADIQVRMNVKAQRQLKDVRPYPVQPQACRCETEKVGFQFDSAAYETHNESYKLAYIGAFRGTPITRLDVNLANYDAVKNVTTLNTQVEFSANVPEYSFEPGEYKDFLIIAPEKLVGGVADFVAWKTSQGYNVTVETLLTPANNLASITALVKKHYTESGTDFVMIIGDETTVPMFKVKTTGSYQTPSDLTHFTMDGADDYVPDMFHSRIAATTPADVTAQLAKSIEFEQKNYQNSFGLKKIIGIASNEGSNPSDKDYILAIEEKFKSVLGTESLFLHQDDKKSNPTTLNGSFNEGAFWLTYLGHGSGSSWPSMNKSYSVSDMKNINNKQVVKSIIIDVACMNGKLAQGFLGTSFMKSETTGDLNKFGAVAYYGGTVNISWHPPAVMARGIAFEHLKKKFNHLGEALLAGQIYLAGNWSSAADVIDNLEWYHLQGDPSMNVAF